MSSIRLSEGLHQWKLANSACRDMPFQMSRDPFIAMQSTCLNITKQVPVSLFFFAPLRMLLMDPFRNTSITQWHLAAVAMYEDV